jgi:hypothetical protein
VKRKRLKYTGTFFFTQSAMYFVAHLFGHSVREVVRFVDVQTMDLLDPKRVRIVTLFKKHRFAFPRGADTAFGICRSLVDQAREKPADSMVAVEESKETTAQVSSPAVEDEGDSVEFNMGPQHWERVLHGTTTKVYPPESTIISEGETTQRIYQIARGHARIMIG